MQSDQQLSAIGGVDAPNFDLGISPPKKKNENVGIQTEKGSGSKRPKKLGEKLRSPNTQRAVTFDVSVDESRIQDWVLRGLGGPHKLIFLGRNGKMLDRRQMVTLAFETEVTPEVIDAWVTVMNDEERLQSDDSPRRLFFTTDVALDHVMLNDELTDEERYESFKRVTHRWGHWDRTLNNMMDVDLVFFPVVVRPFYYLVVVNLKQPSFIVIDTEDREGKITQLDDIYADLLQRMITMHLESNGYAEWSQFEEMLPKRFKVRWQLRENQLDQGVVLMRDMETYRENQLNQISVMSSQNYICLARFKSHLKVDKIGEI